MDTLAILSRPALQRFYRVAGRLLLVEALDEWSVDGFSRFFDGWYFTPSAPDDCLNPDASIRIKCDSPHPQAPADFLRYELPGDGYCQTNGASFFIEFGSSVIRLEESCSSVVEVWLGEDCKDDSPALASIVSYSVSSALRRCGVFELHSGAVCEPVSGKGALIIGESGSGKSTLTLQLATGGWGYLSDDVLLLREIRDKIEAWGLRRDFAVTEETLVASGNAHLKSEGETGPRKKFDFYKRRLPLTELFPAGHIQSCVPSTLLFPTITGEAASKIKEISQAEAMSRLIRMCPWASYDKCTAGKHLRALAQLARQCASFDIFGGKDLLRDPDLAARLIYPLM